MATTTEEVESGLDFCNRCELTSSSSDVERSAASFPSSIVIKALKFYQRLISPLFGQHCRFYPSCSEYSMIAVRRHGILPGLFLSIWRVLRCNPFSDGGVDHVPPKHCQNKGQCELRANPEN